MSGMHFFMVWRSCFFLTVSESDGLHGVGQLCDVPRAEVSPLENVNLQTSPHQIFRGEAASPVGDGARNVRGAARMGTRKTIVFSQQV